MDCEEFVSGYCRALDAARTVAVESESGRWFADCSYGSCPYEAQCKIAQKIKELTE